MNEKEVGIIKKANVIGPFKLGGDVWYLNMYIVCPTILIILLILLMMIGFMKNQSKLMKLLPEAEVKIQLALLKLEQRHAIKVMKNDEHR